MLMPDQEKQPYQSLLTGKVKVVNVGLEGMMLMGAFWGIWAAYKAGSWEIGLLGAAFFAGALAFVHAVFAIHLRADQVVSGTAINILATGITAFAFQDIYGENGTRDTPTIPNVHVANVPVLGQILDVVSFHRIKKITGEKAIWLRATGSTLISQLVDSFLVLFIAFYIGPRVSSNQGAPWSLKLVLSICVGNYIYKFVIAIIMTPVIYWVHNWIEKYLGHDTAAAMKTAAMEKEAG